MLLPSIIIIELFDSAMMLDRSIDRYDITMCNAGAYHVSLRAPYPATNNRVQLPVLCSV